MVHSGLTASLTNSSWRDNLPQLKYALLGGLGLLALVQHEQLFTSVLV